MKAYYRHDNPILVEMTQEEAGVVLALCLRIGGDPAGPGGIISILADSLAKMGIREAKIRTFCSSDYMYIEKP